MKSDIVTGEKLLRMKAIRAKEPRGVHNASFDSNQDNVGHQNTHFWTSIPA
jgi:hypothetical protein